MLAVRACPFAPALAWLPRLYVNVFRSIPLVYGFAVVLPDLTGFSATCLRIIAQMERLISAMALDV